MAISMKIVQVPHCIRRLKQAQRRYSDGLGMSNKVRNKKPATAFSQRSSLSFKKSWTYAFNAFEKKENYLEA